ncbi:hypothetical protein FOZ61_005073 [Perkinsus olseni]|uniref:Uncharacterized protein n=1 Tax=Perkinsus olseni TaxID=32597 RepID=A0A7J6LXT8_PEROL|nr:hypothetical protein FOZ61_005073 [Perkinsus olseni]KAF4663631.1 hypothetical protein FOL46_004644 [Perkinsus olseni]
MLAPWTNSLLSDVWGDRRVSKYFKIGLMAGVWQLFWLGVVPAFTPYWPLPWMPVCSGVPASAVVGMIYYNLPQDGPSLGPRSRFAMVPITLCSAISVFGLAYPVLYFLALKQNRFLRFWICLAFFVLRVVFEKFAKHYARLYCVDCYPMIVLLAMYAYEFFISSVITGVTEVWLAMLLISLDLLENLYYIYCIYKAAYPVPSRNGISPAPPDSRKSNPQGEVGCNRDQRGCAEPAPRSNTNAEHPANGSRNMTEVSENYETARKEPENAQLPVLDSDFHLNGSDKRSNALTCGINGAALNARLANSMDCLGQFDADEHHKSRSGRCSALAAAELARDERSDFSPAMPLSHESPAVNAELTITATNPGGKQRIRDDFSRSGGGIARRRSSMSTLSSFTSLLGTNSIPERPVSSSSDEFPFPYRRSGSPEKIAESSIEANNEQISTRDGSFNSSFSILAVAICKEVVEVVAPMHYLICSLVLRTFNPKLHDTFWDMTDEEFWQGIWRLLIEIVAEASLFIILIIAMKRWFNESVTSIGLRLGYHFSWPFAALQVSLMTYYIAVQYSNSGMSFSFDFKWIGYKSTTWHGGNCYTTGYETIEEVC